METYQLIKFEEVCIHHQLDDNFINTIQDFEIINFTIKDEVLYISSEELPVIERVIRLRYELNINMEGIEVIQRMRTKMEALQDQVQQLNNRLKLYE